MASGGDEDGAGGGGTLPERKPADDFVVVAAVVVVAAAAGVAMDADADDAGRRGPTEADLEEALRPVEAVASTRRGFLPACTSRRIYGALFCRVEYTCCVVSG